MVDLERISKLRGIGIVGAPDQNHVDESHAGEKGKNAPSHDFVFAEETFIPDVAADKSSSYGDGAEDGAPPAVEKRGIVCDAGAGLGRRIVVEGAWQYHGRWGETKQTRASAEGELLESRMLSRMHGLLL
jgi:hypothetical protein